MFDDHQLQYLEGFSSPDALYCLYTLIYILISLRKPSEATQRMGFVCVCGLQRKEITGHSNR